MQADRKKLLKAGALLGAFIAVSVVIMNNEPQTPQRSERPKPLLKVETQQVLPQDYQFTLSSFGTVQPRTQSLLVSQVSGQIIEVDESFRDGGFFDKGDVLVHIDPRDYEASVKVAKAELLQAQLAIVEEQARAQQAQIDWQRLGDGKPAPALVLRQPQLAAVEASVLSAQANLDRALLDLERTRIRAPFDGRLKTAMVDLGQYVSANTQMAEVFATDLLEVRLPLKNSELALMHLPEDYRSSSQSQPQQQPEVDIISQLGVEARWAGLVVRTEAAIDTTSHQLYVVAQIPNPYQASQNADGSLRSTLKIGQYVSAEIEGKTIEQALIIPTASIYQGSYVYLVVDELLQRRDISIGYQTATQAFISSGLKAGDTLITSPLGQVTSGTRVEDLSAVVENRSSRERVASAEGQSKGRDSLVDRSESERLAKTETQGKAQRTEVDGDQP